MVIDRSFVRATAVASMLASTSSAFFTVGALAKATGLECALTSARADNKETTRTISIAFDAEANTLVSYQGAQHRDLANVTISTVSINGNTDDMSIGIDRSSWSIVVQTYSQDHVVAEFGVCKPANAPSH